MYFVSNILIVFITLLHFWFLTLEMFLWQKPIGLKIFRITKDFAKASSPLAANQGLYNGFISAGLIWGIISSEPVQAFRVKIFFLVCTIIAGIFGGLTVNKRIFFVQALPSVLAVIILALAN